MCAYLGACALQRICTYLFIKEHLVILIEVCHKKNAAHILLTDGIVRFTDRIMRFTLSVFLVPPYVSDTCVHIAALRFRSVFHMAFNFCILVIHISYGSVIGRNMTWWLWTNQIEESDRRRQGVHPMADLDWLKIVSGVIKRTILILVTPSKQQWRYQNYVWWTERATASKSTAACFGRGLLPAGQ